LSNNNRIEEDAEKIDLETNAFSADSEAQKLYSRSDEEFAAEVADGKVSRNHNHPANQIFTSTEQADKGRGWGLTALILSIAAWFIWPSLLAPAAVIIGLVAFVRGRRGLGSVAIVLGLIAFFLNIGNAIL